MSIQRNRRLLGLTSTQTLGIIAGIVFILVGQLVLKEPALGDTTSPLTQAWWNQSPIPGVDFTYGRFLTSVGILLILFPVLQMFFVAPLKEAIDTRNNELERTFTEAEELRTSMDQLRKDYEQRLAATEASAREQIQAQIREAQNLRTTLMNEASQRADAMLKQAQDQIEAEKLKAIAELRSTVVELSLGAAEKVIGRNIDSADNRRLIDEFIDKVEVPA